VKEGNFIETVKTSEHEKGAIVFLQGNAVTQTKLDGLTITSSCGKFPVVCGCKNYEKLLTVIAVIMRHLDDSTVC